MNQQRLNLTLIDDDNNFLQILTLALSEECQVTAFNDPEVAVGALEKISPDAILLDLHLKRSNGFEVCEEIKGKRPATPVFFLTSDVEPKNISEGFKKGAADYFHKSMPPKEIVARVKARICHPSKNILECRDLIMNTESFEVVANGQLVNLTPKEFDILKVFLEHQDEMLSKTKLLSLLWKDVNVDANNIDTHMFHIRKKLSGKTLGIECRKGIGYILRSKV